MLGVIAGYDNATFGEFFVDTRALASPCSAFKMFRACAHGPNCLAHACVFMCRIAENFLSTFGVASRKGADRCHAAFSLSLSTLCASCPVDGTCRVYF